MLFRSWKAEAADVRVTVDSGETGDVGMTVDDVARLAVLVAEFHALDAVG